MKNAVLTLLLVIMMVSFFGFTDSRPVARTHEYNAATVLTDTVPRKKDSTKKKAGTTPYDSFGKPKKMDTTRHR